MKENIRVEVSSLPDTITIKLDKKKDNTLLYTDKQSDGSYVLLYVIVYDKATSGDLDVEARMMEQRCWNVASEDDIISTSINDDRTIPMIDTIIVTDHPENYYFMTALEEPQP